METQPPSLLGWLRAQMGRPQIQRLLRFGLALLLIGWGIYQFFRVGSDSSFSIVGASVIGAGVMLFLWALSIKDVSTPIPGMPEMSLNVDLHAPQVLLPTFSRTRPVSLPLPLSVLRLSGVIVLAIFSQT